MVLLIRNLPCIKFSLDDERHLLHIKFDLDASLGSISRESLNYGVKEEMIVINNVYEILQENL